MKGADLKKLLRTPSDGECLIIGTEQWMATDGSFTVSDLDEPTVGCGLVDGDDLDDEFVDGEDYEVVYNS
jgi:hypothetical protein